MQLEEIKQIIDAYENDKPWQYTCGNLAYKCRGNHFDYNGIPELTSEDINVRDEVSIAYLLLNPQYRIEVLPDTIGSEVNGFVLPDGKNWHRDDFTHEHLKGVYRPLLKDEEIEAGDEVLSVYNNKDWSAWTQKEIKFDSITNAAKDYWSHHRTKRPIIPDGYTKHDGSDKSPVDPYITVDALYNDGFTNCGFQANEITWRDVIAYKAYPDPLAELKAAYKNGATIMFKAKYENKWKRAHINDPGKLRWYPEVDYKLAPKQVPLDRKDIAPGDVIELDGRRYLVKYDSHIYNRDIAIGNRYVDYEHLQSRSARINRSFSNLGAWDESVWEPCYKDDPNS